MDYGIHKIYLYYATLYAYTHKYIYIFLYFLKTVWLAYQLKLFKLH